MSDTKINRVSNIIICDDCLDGRGKEICDVSTCLFGMFQPPDYEMPLREIIDGLGGEIRCLGTENEVFSKN